jgi:hypothetical protein
MRPGEINGKDYHFVDNVSFRKGIQEKEFLESISFNGFQYGVSRNEIQKAHDSGKTAVLIVEPNGLVQILKYSIKNNIDVKSVYIGGNTWTLLERYIGRMVGETITVESAKRHSTRIQSMKMERIKWEPTWCENEFEGLNLKDTTLEIEGLDGEKFPDKIPYNIILKDLGPENMQEVIDRINKIEFKNEYALSGI